MLTGFFLLSSDRPGEPCAAAACLDVAGLDAAAASPDGLIRVYEDKHRPEPAIYGQKIVTLARSFPRRLYQLGNEGNLVAEGFGGGPADYAGWAGDVRGRIPAGVLVGVGAFSPGDAIAGVRSYSDVDGWDALVPMLDADPELVAIVHVYAPTLQGLIDCFLRQAERLPHHTPIVVGEVNFGPGPTVHVDRDAWAENALRPFLDWLNAEWGVRAAYYFAYRWPEPDPWFKGGTPVDAAGTAIERVIRAWTDPVRLTKPAPDAGSLNTHGPVKFSPKEPPVPDIVLTAKSRESLALPENYQKGPRAKTIGVVIHTTRGGGRPETELSSTIAWFQNPDAQVSAHLIIGLPPFSEVVRCVHDDDIAWHCREANANHLGIEICQPTASYPLTPFQYEAAAEACRLWAKKYGFPLRRVMSQNEPGIVGHEDTEAGKRDHKTDPGPAFDWARFLALLGAVPDAPKPTPATMPAQSVVALQDETYALASQLQGVAPRWAKAGHPQMAEFVAQIGEAVKRTVVIGKGEK